MRAVLLALSLITMLPTVVLAQSSSLREVTTLENNRVDADTEGYRQVKVVVELKTSTRMNKKPIVGSTGKFVFGLKAPIDGIRHNKDGVIDAIGHFNKDVFTKDQRFFPKDVVWIKVKFVVDNVDKDSFTLGTEIVLPVSIVENKAHAYSMRDGVLYVGTWNTEGGQARLELKPRS